MHKGKTEAEVDQVHVQRQTKIKMNDIDVPKFGGRRPSGPKVGGASAPAGPPVPGRMGGKDDYQGIADVKERVIINLANNKISCLTPIVTVLWVK